MCLGQPSQIVSQPSWSNKTHLNLRVKSPGLHVLSQSVYKDDGLKNTLTQCLLVHILFFHGNYLITLN